MKIKVCRGLEEIMGENPVSVGKFIRKAGESFIPIVGDIQIYRAIKLSKQCESKSEYLLAKRFALLFVATKYIVISSALTNLLG